MPPSRRTPRRRTKPPQGLQGGRLGQQTNKHEERWDVRFRELLDYRSEHGSCNVPRSRGQLGAWVGTQRTSYMAGTLAQDRVDRLNGIGFKWSLMAKGPNVPWETRFDELVQYKTKHGDCNVPQRQGNLGIWVSYQRKVYMAGSLAQDRVDRLNSIGFKWSLMEKKQIQLWETRFHELVQYKAKHDDCNVPRNQGQLGAWVHTQRVTYKKNKLSQDRIDRLNDIAFDWTPPRGGSRKSKAPSSTRKRSLSRKEKPSPSTNVNSLSDGYRARGAEPNGIEGGGRHATSAPSLKVPSKRCSHNPGTESDDEDDEIGALIYDQVMRQRRPPQPLRPEGVPIKTEEIETESETETGLFKSEEVPVKTEEKIKYSCETDDESALD